jgi:hypothetical protein
LVIAVDLRPGKASLTTIRTQLAKLRDIAGCPAVYVTGELASYERKRLIAQKVPFIVPGNQLYLPDLGIDLREHFRASTLPGARLSPAAQAMFIMMMMKRPWNAEFDPAQIMTELGYTSMTNTRAVREFTAAGLATLHARGKVRVLRMDRGAAETWDFAKPMLRSPVKTRFWTDPIPDGGRLAGLSALARYSMLEAPPNPTFALGPQQWKKISRRRIEKHTAPQTGTCEWQLWNYSTALDPNLETVDLLSLSLSLEQEADERVQQALEALKEQFPW